jgi:sugar lactone lactonase YvrE
MFWFLIGITIGVIGKIWFLVVAYKKSLGWALACALIPGISLIFLFLYFKESRSPALTILIGLGLGALGIGDVVATLRQSANPYVRVYHTIDAEEMAYLLPLLRDNGLHVIYSNGGDIVVQTNQQQQAMALIKDYASGRAFAHPQLPEPANETPREREDRRMRDNGIIRDPDYTVVASVFCGPMEQFERDGKGHGNTIEPPIGIAVTPDGTVIFGTANDGRIYRVLPDRSLETIAEIGPRMMSKDGDRIDAPIDLFADANGTVHVCTGPGVGLARINPDGSVEMRTLLPGSLEMPEKRESTNPSFLSITGNGNGLVLVSTMNGILYVDSQGHVRPFNLRENNPTGDRLMTQAMMMTASGDVICGNMSDGTIRLIYHDGVIATIAGTGKSNAHDGEVRAAHFGIAQDIAVHPDGDIFVLESDNIIRRILPYSSVTTLTMKSMSVDYRSSNSPRLDDPFVRFSRIAIAPDKTIYVTDSGTRVIWKLELVPRLQEP